MVLFKAREKANRELNRMKQSFQDIDFLLKLGNPANAKTVPKTKKLKRTVIKIDLEHFINVIDSYLKQELITTQEREVERLPPNLGKLPSGIVRSHAPSGAKWIQVAGTLSDHGKGPLQKEIGPRVDFIYRLLERIHQSVLEMLIPHDTLTKKNVCSYNPKSLIIIDSDFNNKLSLDQSLSLHRFVENYIEEKIGIELSRLAENNYVKEKIDNLSKLATFGDVWLDGYKEEAAKRGSKPKHMVLGRY